MKIALTGAALVLACGVSYKLFTDVIPNLYALATGQVLNGKMNFGPWHSLYIGLGWEKNKYGICFMDEYGAALAINIDPQAIYPTPRYMEVMRGEWFRLWREDPGYMLGTYCRKLLACVRNDLKYSLKGYVSGFVGWKWLLAACGAGAVLRYVARKRKILRTWGLLFLFAAVCAVVGLDMPMIAVPSGTYTYGSFAGCSMVFVVLALALICAAASALEEFSKRDLTTGCS